MELGVERAVELDVERAKELIEQKLAEEEKEEVGPEGRGTLLGCSRNPHGTLSILRDMRSLAPTLPSWGIYEGVQGLSGGSSSQPGSSSQWGRTEQNPTGAQLPKQGG